jgi:transcriptional regulator with XRE-family HTH domain
MVASTDNVASKLIEGIRNASGLSQSELARRSGLQPSVLSAYEHGRRQPSVSALARIARGAGLRLELTPTLDDASLERQARILEMVLDLACSLPFKGHGELQYPPLIRLGT